MVKRRKLRKPTRKETLREKTERETQNYMNQRKGILSKVPILGRFRNDKIARQKAKKILEESKRIYVPQNSQKAVKGETREIAGKTRIYQATEKGEKVAIVVPRFKEEYTIIRNEEEVIRGYKGLKGRTLRSKKQLEESLKEGEIGIAHTHPLEKKAELSEFDRTHTKHSDAVELIVSQEEAVIGYKDKEGKVKEKKATFITREKLGKLMKDEVKERSRRKALPILKKKKQR